ncbi:hypothetical protein D8674_008447 [Pyrus ussuriensis x Pyrus communis]|uniref:Uncharacterized protein n=1 Tax=Pyrus ussuriensis x Pyrus communis TaxID=2448454 RepID=A0A5N5HTQ5_9ROSA|nr:hypothetical protein D8674_008447 [Pyrus ussuriensis x Pyrus communis]
MDQLSNDSSLYLCRISSSMSSSSHKSDDDALPLYSQDGYLSKVGYFKAAYFKISSDDSFRDFLKVYGHAIPSGMRVKKGSSRELYSGARRAIKFHPYYFVLGFTFPMPHFFQVVLCSMKCAPAQCSPNEVRVMVGFLNLSQFLDLDLIVNEFWYFFDIDHIDGVGQLRSRHRLCDHSSKGDHGWSKETFEINAECESDSSLELCVSMIFIIDLKFGSTPKISPDMKKVNVALGIPEKYGLPTRNEIKQIKMDALACPIVVMEPVVNEGEKKRSSLPAQEILVEKKWKISFAAHEGPLFSIGLFLVPLVTKFVLRRLVGAKSSSPLERLVTMKSDKVDFTAKMVPKPIPLAAEICSPAEKDETARVGSCEKSTKFVSGEAADICVLLKPYLLEDIDAYTKLVDDVRGKTVILAAESMFLNQEDTKAANKMAKTMAAEAYSSVKMIKRLESELVILKRSNISASTFLQLETARQEIIQVLECAISEVHSTTYVEDEELIAAYNQVINFKKVVDRLEPQVLELYGALKINKNLKKKVDELQRIHTQANFYKLGYVDHLFGRPSDFVFSGKDFKTFFISLKDLLAFTFKVSIGEVVGEQAVGSLLETIGYLNALGSSFRVLGQSFIGLEDGFLEAVENRLVVCFSLPIALGIPWRGHVQLDSIFLEELRQIFAYKLWAIVCDDGLRDAKSANDVPLYKVFYVRLSYVGGISPTKSIDHCINSQRLVCKCSSLAGSAGTNL